MTTEAKDQPERCDHDHQRSGYSSGFGLIEYECTKCGDTYDRDVS